MNRTLVTIVRFAGLGGLDRLLGTVFGFARGALVVIVVTAICARLGFAESVMWQESQFIGAFVSAADWIQAVGINEAGKLFQSDTTT